MAGPFAKQSQSMRLTTKNMQVGGTQFSAEVGAWVHEVTDNIDSFVKGLVIRLFSEIIMRTPVDTGRARSNWQLGINAPITTSLITSLDTGPVTSDGSGSSDAKSRMIADVNATTVTAVQAYYLTNNVHYVPLLEYGHSQRQAPAGMVRISVQNFQQMVAEIKSELATRP